MAILSTETLDDIGEGLDIDTADLAPGWVTKNGRFTSSADAAAHGDRGGQVQSASSAHRIEYEEATTSSVRVFSWYFRIDEMPSSNCYIGSMMSAGNGADFRINTDRTVTLRNERSATGGGASTEQLTVGDWYRVEWRTSTSGQELRIFESESTSAHITIVGNLTDTSKTGFAAGVTSAPNGISLSIDTLRVADDWLGPYGTPAEPLDTPTNFQFVADPGPNKVEIVASWSNVTGADSYELEVEERDGEDWIPQDAYRKSESPITLTDNDGLEPGVTYRGRVRALPSGW